MSKYQVEENEPGEVIQSAVPTVTPNAEGSLSAAGLQLRGVVIAKYYFDTPAPAGGAGGWSPVGRRRAMYCDVLVYSNIPAYHGQAIPRVMIGQRGSSLHTGEVWSPRAAKLDITGREIGLDRHTNPFDLDGTHVLVGFIDDDRTMPIVLMELFHPNADNGNADTLEIGHRLRPKEGTLKVLGTGGTSTSANGTTIDVAPGALPPGLIAGDHFELTSGQFAGRVGLISAAAGTQVTVFSPGIGAAFSGAAWTISRPILAEEPALRKHHGIVFGVDALGNFVIDATRAHDGVLDAAGKEVPGSARPNTDVVNPDGTTTTGRLDTSGFARFGNLRAKLPADATLTIEFASGRKIELTDKDGKLVLKAASVDIGDGANMSAVLGERLRDYINTGLQVMTAFGPSGPPSAVPAATAHFPDGSPGTMPTALSGSVKVKT